MCDAEKVPGFCRQPKVCADRYLFRETTMMSESTQAQAESPALSGWSALLFVLICTLVRVAFISRIPLLGAEAYYWEWSRYPDWGYFDHPPMVAFLIRLATGLGGDTVMSVKLAAVVAGLLTTGVLYVLARDMFGPRTAAAFCCILQILPFYSAVNVVTVPDTPLALFWSLTMLFVHRAACRGRPPYWYAAGGALGLALLSKYHAFLLFPCVLLFLVLWRDGRFWLRRKEPWCAALIALLVFSPNAFWNMTHGMRTFQFLLSERHGTLALQPVGAALFVGGVLVMLSPLLAVLILRLQPRIIRRALAEQNGRYLLLLCTSLPILIFFALLSPLISVGAHWPAVAYPGLVLAAVALLCSPETPRDPRLNSRFARVGIVLSVILVLAGHIVPVVLPMLPPTVQIAGRSLRLENSRLYVELQGWPELGAAVVDLAAAMPEPDRTFIMTHSYRLASQIRFYSNSALITRTTGHPGSHQYLIWNRRYDLCGRDALFVGKRARERYRSELEGIFEQVGPFEPVVIRRGSRDVRTFYIVRCYGFLGTRPEECNNGGAP